MILVLMDQIYFFKIETAIKWQFKCIFAFKLQHEAICRLIQFPYKETSTIQKIIVLRTVDSLICDKIRLLTLGKWV